MKNFFSIAVLGGAVALAVLLAPPAAAQSSILRCNVPFAFAAGDRVVPAGEYRVAIDNGLRLFRIDSLSDNSYWIVQMMPEERPGPQLVPRQACFASRSTARSIF